MLFTRFQIILIIPRKGALMTRCVVVAALLVSQGSCHIVCRRTTAREAHKFVCCVDRILDVFSDTEQFDWELVVLNKFRGIEIRSRLLDTRSKLTLFIGVPMRGLGDDTFLLMDMTPQASDKNELDQLRLCHQLLIITGSDDDILS
jgi:hypothetical protein